MGPAIACGRACLYNNQGWIPQRLGEEIFSHEVDPPDVRVE
jgi:hypothetical protein